jgi:hypothetical protein
MASQQTKHSWLSPIDCKKAFVLGTSTEHYRCWKFWSVTTHATRIWGAAFFKHKYLTTPTVTPEDKVIAAAGGACMSPRQSNAPPHARIHYPGPQTPPSCLPTSRHQLHGGSHHPCHPSGTSKGALGCTSQASIPCHTSKGGHYQAISLTIPSSLQEPSVIQGCMTASRHLLCQLDWISWKILFPCNVSCHDKAHGQTHLRSEPHPCHLNNHTNYSK